MGEHVRLMGDMMVLAFQADLTRICTLHALPMMAATAATRTSAYRKATTICPITAATSTSRSRSPRSTCIHMQQVAYFLEKDGQHPRGRRPYAAGQQHDCVRRGHQRRRPPQPRRPADFAGRRGARERFSRASTSSSRRIRRSTTCSSRCWIAWASMRKPSATAPGV